MNIYCFECGAANHYTYSSGKPKFCSKCSADFALKVSEISATSPTTYTPTIRRGARAHDWTKRVKLDELITISFFEGDFNPKDYADEGEED